MTRYSYLATPARDMGTGISSHVCDRLPKKDQGQGPPEDSSESLSPLFLTLVIHTMEVLIPNSRSFRGSNEEKT